MLCQKPIATQIGMVPCRQCLNCRINLQRTWASRIQLEAMWHPYSVFVTLTYDEESCPVTESKLATLSPQDLTKFLKRFRNSNGSFRYFACGEYGTQTERPHYHLVIFGISVAWESQISTAWSEPGTTKKPTKKKGFTSVYELNEARAAYVAQYTVKKMTKEDHPKLNGRYPEFARMSKGRDGIGGIGSPCIKWLADQHRTRLGSRELAEQGDVFNAIRINGKIWPLGQYLRKRLRDELGVPQTASERAVKFNKVYHPEPHEWASPIRDYCPHTDIVNVLTPYRVVQDEKDKKAELPEINKKADHRQRRIKRRQQPTINV